MSFVSKQYGPFTGGVWILIVVGGVVIAYFLRRSFGQGQKSEPAIAIETVKSPRVFGDVGQYGSPPGGKGEEEKKPPPVLPVRPPQPADEVLQIESPLKRRNCPPGMKFEPFLNRCIPIVQPVEPTQPVLPVPQPPQPPQREVPQPPAPPPQPSAKIPGGFPAGCEGITYGTHDPFPAPADTSQSGINAWLDNIVGAYSRAEHIKLRIGANYATTGRTGEGDLESIAIFWRLMPGALNGHRRAQGLRALNEQQIQELLRWLDVRIQQRKPRNDIYRPDVYELFDKWYTPFLCNVTPSGPRLPTIMSRNLKVGVISDN